jgi:hypothetical protein
LPSTPGTDASVGLGLNAVLSGATANYNGNTYVGFDITTSFPLGFDFSSVGAGNGWASSNYNILLKVREVGSTSGFDTYNLQVPMAPTPVLGTSWTVNFPPHNGGAAYFSPQLIQGVEYELGFTVICTTDSGSSVGAGDYLWWNFQA